ncbi:unnamed protein product [Oncorhynchus mykiss]|uniref:LRRNT domain-containing protein n=1 Tax=Oncorhynchus mykiss TaxID=8022 RepID=A0A060WJB3_ONCMY|nr:unnamed protein product [Oncorhynchus mykiss]
MILSVMLPASHISPLAAQMQCSSSAHPTILMYRSSIYTNVTPSSLRLKNYVLSVQTCIDSWYMMYIFYRYLGFLTSHSTTLHVRQDLNYNDLAMFPTAIRALPNLKELSFHSNNIRSVPEEAFVGNPSLDTIYFYNNPIQFVGKSAFQHLPALRMLSLNGATDITEFPDLTGTNSLETL